MTLRSTIAVALCLYGGAYCAAISQLDVEQVVRRRMVQRGLRMGFDAEKGTYTVIASAVKSEVEPRSSVYCAQRTRTACFRLAELKAIHQILNLRAQTMAGETAVQWERSGEESIKTVRTFVETFSQSDMDGCVVVDSCELSDGAKCAMAVAMTWSVDLENHAHASKDGKLRPSETWNNELKRHLEKWGDGMLPPVVAFVDSSGFFHRVGVGMSRFVGESSLERDVAIQQADLWARKNLQLALYGLAAMRKKAELMRVSSRRDDLKTLASVYEALGEVAAEGPMPTGSCPLIDRVVSNGSGLNKFFVVVYGVKPSVAFGGYLEPSAASGTIPSAVKIWNPNTGKFETVKE